MRRKMLVMGFSEVRFGRWWGGRGLGWDPQGWATFEECMGKCGLIHFHINTGIAIAKTTLSEGTRAPI